MPGVIKVLDKREDRSIFYNYQDVMEMLGVSKSYAYKRIAELQKEAQANTPLTRHFPAGKIPKSYFDKVCLIEN